MTIDLNGRATSDYKVMKREYVKADAMQVSVGRLHERMGHAGQDAIDRLIREQLVNGIGGIKPRGIGEYNICKLGNLPQKLFPTVEKQSGEKLKVMRTDKG